MALIALGFFWLLIAGLAMLSDGPPMYFIGLAIFCVLLAIYDKLDDIKKLLDK